jgi:signal transduction histidine kinase
MEAVIETLASIHQHGESVTELAHDARNMVTALSLYCDLLDEPGVLASTHRHYASELRLVAEGSRRLVEKLARLDGGDEDASPARVSTLQAPLFPEIAETRSAARTRTFEIPAGALNVESVCGGLCGGLIDDLRDELLSSRGLLAAIAGPSVTVSTAANGGAQPVRMSGENLIRALVNLVKNSAESIDGPGTIDLRLDEQIDHLGQGRSLILTLEDTGCGIPPEFLEKIFDPGFSTHPARQPGGGWTSGHRGLGLAITRSIITAAGGRIHAQNRAPKGTRFVIELPVRNT